MRPCLLAKITESLRLPIVSAAQQFVAIDELRPRSRGIFTTWCALLLIVSVSATFPKLTRAQGQDLIVTKEAESQLDSLAFRVGEKIKQSKRGNEPIKILVFDFTRVSLDKSSILGTLLADRFTDMLRHHGNGMEILDRDLLKNYLRKLRTNIGDLDANSVYLQIAQDLGATDAIRAELTKDDKQQLRIRMQRLGDPEFYDVAQFLLPMDLEEILIKPVPSNYADPETIPPEAGVIFMGSKPSEGVDSPKCISCPDPKFTPVARAAKFTYGSIILSGVVTTKGEVTSVFVVKGLPFGLTESALTVIRDWKLTPAMKNGQPVAVRVAFEFTFRSS
jgi:TonB family protein